MSSSLLAPAPMRRTHSNDPIRVTLSYREALCLIKMHAGIAEREENPEVSELLNIIVLQYFDLPVGNKPQEMLRRYDDLMASLSDLIKSPSLMQSNVELMLISICHQYLPRFRAYSTEDCQAILSSCMEGTNLILTMTHGHFKKFTAAEKKSDNPFSTRTRF